MKKLRHRESCGGALPGKVSESRLAHSHPKSRNCEHRVGAFRALPNLGFLFSEVNTQLEIPLHQEVSINGGPSF